MDKERGDRVGQFAFQRMTEFIQSGMSQGYITSYILEGPTADAPTNFTHFAGVFPGVTPEEGSEYWLAGTSSGNPIALNSKILTLEIPERHRVNRPAFNEENAELFSLSLAVVGLPSLVLGFGRSVGTGEEVIALFAPINRSPQRALAILQDRVRSRMIKLN